MNILIACEESQVVCVAFRNKGHNAFSCDLQPCSGGHPEWHIQGDVLPLINGRCTFFTMDSKMHVISDRWDMIIAHPPCTRLCTTGQRWLFYGDKSYRSIKLSEQRVAIVFFMRFVFADCDKIVIENPQGVMSTCYRPPDCIYNPYDFEGETEQKKTCLWLKNVPLLQPTRLVPLPKDQRTHGIFKSHFDGSVYAWGSEECARFRSRTPIGVASAMADQWG